MFYLRDISIKAFRYAPTLRNIIKFFYIVYVMKKCFMFMRKHQRLILTLLAMSVIAVIYFGFNYFNSLQAVVYTNFGFAFEKNIPLIPLFVLLYLTVYFVYITPFFFVFNVRKYKHVLAAYLFVAFVSGLFYVILPTKMIWEPFTAKTATDCLIPFLRALDSPNFNLLPSMHVSLAFLATFVVASENRKWGYFLAIASTLIAFSTLFTKQHYVLDLLAGLLLAIVAYLFFVYKW